jgi:hypothetical protein
MLAKNQMQEIQDLKLRGHTQTEIIEYYKSQGLKPPSRPTIAKYYNLDVVPDNPGEKLAKDKAFDVEPFKSTIIATLEVNSGKDFCISSVYDLLEEKFIDSGEYEQLPGNEQTLRNYVHYIRDSGQSLVKILDNAETERIAGFRLKNLKKARLVIIDEIGYTPIGRSQANRFFTFISDTYETSSIIFTHQQGDHGLGRDDGESSAHHGPAGQDTSPCQLLLVPWRILPAQAS